MTVDWEQLWEQPEAAPNGHPVELRHASEGDTPYGMSALRDEAALVATAPVGQRNDTLNRAWYRMGKVVAGGNLTHDTAHHALADAARSAGLDQTEIDLVLRTDTTSGFTAGSTNPRIPQPRDPVPEPTVLPVPTGDPEIDADAISNAVRDKFPLLDWHELWTREDTEEWIVEPILPARRLVALFSAPKVGKSLLMLEIAVGIATGTPVLGQPDDQVQRRRVLYVDFENDPRGDIYERLTAMGQSPADLDDLCYLSYPTLAKLDTYTGALELMAIIAEYQCEVVVIDTISRAVAGEENENDTWLAFYRNTGLAMKQAGVACIRLDHTGKDHDKGMRGGSAKYGDVDAVWKLSIVDEGNTYRLECTDHRLPISEKTLVLHRHDNPLRHNVDAEGRSAVMRVLIDRTMADLDELEVPPDTGRPGCIQALKDAGRKYSTNALSEAIRRRKIAANPTVLDFE